MSQETENNNLNPSDDPVAIVQEMQTLTDIESDLAQTALAVAEAPVVTDQVLEQAQSTEQILETSIPPAPPTDSAAEESDPSLGTKGPADALDVGVHAAVSSSVPATGTGIDAQPVESVNEEPTVERLALQDAPITLPADAFIPPVPAATATPSSGPDDLMQPAPSDAVHAIDSALQAVAADLPNPVLPPEVSEPAHDVPGETIAEASTSDIKIEVEPPTIENMAEASHNPENDVAVAPTTAPPIVKEESRPLPPQAGDIHDEAKSAAPLTPLPEGLTDASPSARANPQWIRQWRQDPADSYVVLALFNWSISKSEISDARAWFAALYEENPTAMQPLLSLIGLELDLSNFQQVEALFAKALKGPSGGITAAADVSIWKAYLHYIRRQNPVNEGAPDGEQVRETIRKAYEFAVKECGHDRESGEIWHEYISFLGEANAKNPWETQQQMDRLRAVYQRAICIPLNNIEALWKAYDAFESGLNKQTSKKFLADRSPAYMTARTALRELRQLTDTLPRPPLPPRPAFSDADRAAVAGWKQYLKWEEGNPLVIDDPTKLDDRIAYSLRKCVGEMRHFPELWHYAASYYLKREQKDQAVEVLRAGVQACPKSFLLTFALADLEEDLKHIAEASTAYDNLLAALAADLDTLKASVASEVEAAKGPEVPQLNGGGDVDMTTQHEKLVEEREKRGKLVGERRGRDIEAASAAIGVVWVMYMRHARRATGIKAARSIFGKARKSPHITWHVFDASAMMEYHSNKDSAVAVRIFELGLKMFADNADFVIKYLQFLLSINDDTNARALFERSALNIPAEKARPLWDTWAKYEYMYGDLSAVHKLETRFAEVFPNDSPLKRFAQRFIYNSLDEIAIQDLGFGRSPVPPPSGPMPRLPSGAPAPTLPAGPATILPPAAHSSPSQKRPAPESPPRQRARSPQRGSRDFSEAHDEPAYKRSRGPSPRRFPQAPPPPTLPAYGQNQPRFNPPLGDRGTERSPMPPPMPPSQIQPPMYRHDRQVSGGPPPPVHNSGPAFPSAPPPTLAPSGAMANARGGEGFDRSGLTRPLAWFMSTLPSNRYFDGPVFRPDDIMGLFGNIDARGVGMPSGPAPSMLPPPQQRAPPPPTIGGYGGPPPVQRAYDRDPRYGHGAPPPPPPMYGGRRY